jgi:hypothetical protein
MSATLEGKAAAIEYRSEGIGSLLRPPYLADAGQQVARGEITAAAFKKMDDRAVDEAVALQEAAGSTSSPTASSGATPFSATWSNPSTASTSSAARRSRFETRAEPRRRSGVQSSSRSFAGGVTWRRKNSPIW